MIDFKQITKTSNLYNFHSHSPYCDGKAPIESFIVEAIKSGFTHYGVSPHSPIPFYSPCNMDAMKVPEYFAEMDRLKDKYGTKIHLYTSMEIDFLGNWGASTDYFQKMPLDYRISSVHFIPSFNSDEFVDIDGDFDNFKIKMNRYFNDDIERVVRSFYEQSIRMVEKGGFDIIGHFDKIGFNANLFAPSIVHEAWYTKLVSTLIDAIMDHELIVEINTKKWISDRRLFPSQFFFKQLKHYNAQVVFNSDSHSPDLINSGRFEAMEIYRNA